MGGLLLRPLSRLGKCLGYQMGRVSALVHRAGAQSVSVRDG